MILGYPTLQCSFYQQVEKVERRVDRRRLYLIRVRSATCRINFNEIWFGVRVADVVIGAKFCEQIFTEYDSKEKGDEIPHFSLN